MIMQSLRSAIALTALFVCLSITLGVAGQSGEARLVDVRKVWDADNHAAFTDLTRFDGAFYLAFREADEHAVPALGRPGGKLRVLRSETGQKWESVALISGKPGEDLRDARLNVTPDNRLMLNGAAAPQDAPSQRQSYVWFSDDGRNWTDPKPVGEPNWWMWRTQWVGNTVYGIGYGDTTHGPTTTRLYRSDNGVDYDIHVETLTDQPRTNEAALVFREDGSVVTLVRRDGAGATALLGVSHGDFTDWTFTDTGVYVGGPDMIELPDGRLIVAGRFIEDGKPRTALAWVDPDAGTLRKFLTLPSGGDTSYPGLVWHDARLWVSYYSSHEGNASIYVAQVEIPM